MPAFPDTIATAVTTSAGSTAIITAPGITGLAVVLTHADFNVVTDANTVQGEYECVISDTVGNIYYLNYVVIPAGIAPTYTTSFDGNITVPVGASLSIYLSPTLVANTAAVINAQYGYI